jgi:uncharacterized membrane protein YqjE
MALSDSLPRSFDTPSSVPKTTSSVKQLLTGIARYASARGRLVALETRLALGEMKTGLILMGGAAIALAVGLAVLVVGLVLLVAMVLPQANGAAACGAVGGVLILGAGLMIWRGKKALTGQNFYPVTRAEFQIDQQCLKNP